MTSRRRPSRRRTAANVAAPLLTDVYTMGHPSVIQLQDAMLHEQARGAHETHFLSTTVRWSHFSSTGLLRVVGPQARCNRRSSSRLIAGELRLRLTCRTAERSSLQMCVC